MIRISDDVYAVSGEIASLGEPEIATVRERARLGARGRARVCAHRSAEDPVQEMLIVIHRDSYIRPHRHPGKSESFHVVEGLVDVVVLDDIGSLVNVIELGAYGSGRRFFYRMTAPAYHTIITRSEFLVVHEVTGGPFIANQTEMAPFAPAEVDQAKSAQYRAALERAVAEWIGDRDAAARQLRSEPQSNAH